MAESEKESCVIFFLITQYIAICPKTFSNRV